MDKLPKVRLATRNDVPQLIEMGRGLFLENGIGDWDEQLVLYGVDKAIRHDGSVLVVIGEPGKIIQAMMHLYLTSYWYTNNIHLEELYHYVRPEFRRSNNAKALLKYAKNLAGALDIPLFISILSNNRTEAKVRLYEREFGKRSGAFFLFNTSTGVSA